MRILVTSQHGPALGVYEYTGIGRTLKLSVKVPATPCIVRVQAENGSPPELVRLPDGVYAPDPELDNYLD